LSKKNDRDADRRVLQQIEPHAPAAEVTAKADGIMASSAEQVSSAHFWTRQLRKPILLAVLIAFFNQMSGINAVLYFAPRIFELTGLGAKAARLQSVGIGITNLVFTFVGLWLIDTSGAGRFFISVHSDTLLLSGWLPGDFSRRTTRLFPFAFSPSSPLTRLAKAPCSGCSSPKYFPTAIAPKVKAWAALRTGFLPPCLRRFSQDGFCFCSRIRFLVFHGHDVFAASVGENHGSGNQEHAAGNVAEGIGAWMSFLCRGTRENSSWCQIIVPPDLGNGHRSCLLLSRETAAERRMHHALAAIFAMRNGSMPKPAGSAETAKVRRYRKHNVTK
jgi:sugar transport protein